MSHPRPLFALGLLTAIFATVSAQPGGQPGRFNTEPVPLITVLLPFVGDENFQKELKLTEEQTRKLLAYRKKVWDETYTTAPKDRDPKERNKATEAEFKAVLNAEQLQRAQQLAAQTVLNTAVPGAGAGALAPPPARLTATTEPRRLSAIALLQYPELATLLKLDDTQKKLVEVAGPFGGPLGRSALYLTPEQATTAKEMLGTPVKVALSRQFDERNSGPGGFGGPFGAGTLLSLTGAKDIQKELKLSDEQVKALAELRRKVSSGPGPLGPPSAVSPEQRIKDREEQRAETAKALLKILNAEQEKRLKQIELQQLAGQFAASEFTVEEYSKALGITEAQRKKYIESLGGYSEVIAKIALSDEPIEKVKTSVEAATKDWEKSLNSILTADQLAKKKELLGSVFIGRTSGGGFGGPSPLAELQRQYSFGHYTNQLTTLTRFTGLHEELKLTKEQLEKIAEHTRELGTKFPGVEMLRALDDPEAGAKFFYERSEFIEKGLADTLTKEQQTRFRQLMLQWAESGTTPNLVTVPSAAAYPGVAKEIKLTVEQRKKLLAGETAAEVLTDAQKKAIKEMLGEPAKIAEIFATRTPPGAVRTPAPWVQLLLDPAMWDAIKLTPVQTKNLVHAANEYMLVTSQNRAGGFPGPGGAPPPGTEKLVAAQETFSKAAEAILTAEQRKRLDQLAIQQRVATSLYTAFTRSTPAGTALSKALELTPEQVKKMEAAASGLSARSVLLTPLTLDSAKETEIRMKLRERLDERIMKELTAAQLAKWKELTGEAYTGFVKQPLFGGGAGGGFGGGAGGLGGGGFGGFGGGAGGSPF
jgi:hypothetical protein